MQISYSTVAILAASFVGTNAIPQAVQTLSTNQGPTIITGDKMGAAAFIDGYSSTIVVYQAADTSVRVLRGYDPPLNTYSYSNGVILAANVARNDTPLAITIEYDAAEYGAGPPRNVPHLYYLSADTCPGGNYVYELYQHPTLGWRDGLLNNLKVCSSSASNLLYAIWPRACGAAGAGSATSSVRVGYMCAGSGYLCEAYFTSVGGSAHWTTTQF